MAQEDYVPVASISNLGPMRYQIDGARFSTLEEFFDEVSRVLVPEADFWKVDEISLVRFGHGDQRRRDIAS